MTLRTRKKKMRINQDKPPARPCNTDPMKSLYQPLTFTRGKAMPNKFMLAPLTNMQSHSDGVLSDEEFHWLTLRAKGGFGATMTCAAHVDARGQGFAGQLGIFDDKHIPGLTKLASAINATGSVSLAQLHHAGIRSPKELIGEQPVGPSDDEETGARALSTGEVEALIDSFATAAQRAEQAGFNGVELHGAHGYILCAFISPQTNVRTDQFGGDLTNRARPLTQAVTEIRKRCNPNFTVGVRLSPERFGIVFDEALTLAQTLLRSGGIDFLDMSLWDCFKEPNDEAHKGRTLVEHFAALDRGDVRLGVAGKIMTPADVTRVIELGADFPLLGRAAILNHDFPTLMRANPSFQPATIPVSATHLANEGLSPNFIAYMQTWKGFVSESN
jgi:2,4-dienoyl-CoA reductase-like NADH-dependent reductase (Old Yellow Enzyme family)